MVLQRGRHTEDMYVIAHAYDYMHTGMCGRISNYTCESLHFHTKPYMWTSLDSWPCQYDLERCCICVIECGGVGGFVAECWTENYLATGESMGTLCWKCIEPAMHACYEMLWISWSMQHVQLEWWRILPWSVFRSLLGADAIGIEFQDGADKAAQSQGVNLQVAIACGLW